MKERVRCGRCACCVRYHVYVKRKRLSNETAGICRECKRPTKPGLKRCPKHHAYDLKRQLKVRKLKRELGECASCKAPAMAGHRQCEGHLRAARENYHSAGKVKRVRREIARAEAGLCVRCQQPKPPDKWGSCEPCRIKRRAK